MNSERPDFKRAMRGYDTTEVEQAWADIGRTLADLNADNKELKLQLNSLREQNTEWGNRLKSYEKMETDLRDALISAQRIAKQVKEEAEHNAEGLLSSTRMEVETLLNEAQEDVRKIVEETNLQLLENQQNILNMKNEIVELTTRKEEIQRRVEKTADFLGILQHSLQEFLSEEQLI